MVPLPIDQVTMKPGQHDRGSVTQRYGGTYEEQVREHLRLCPVHIGCIAFIIILFVIMFAQYVRDTWIASGRSRVRVERESRPPYVNRVPGSGDEPEAIEMISVPKMTSKPGHTVV